MVRSPESMELRTDPRSHHKPAPLTTLPRTQLAGGYQRIVNNETAARKLDNPYALPKSALLKKNSEMKSESVN